MGEGLDGRREEPGREAMSPEEVADRGGGPTRIGGGEEEEEEWEENYEGKRSPNGGERRELRHGSPMSSREGRQRRGLRRSSSFHPLRDELASSDWSSFGATLYVGPLSHKTANIFKEIPKTEKIFFFFVVVLLYQLH